MEDTLSTDPAVRDILERIERREGVRRVLDGGGLISVDRGLPYLLVHRQRGGREDAGTARLVSGEASYLLSGTDPATEVGALVARVAEAGSTGFGAFLVLEIWSGEVRKPPRFVVHGPPGRAEETVNALADGLRELRGLHTGVEVEVSLNDLRHPPGLPPLLSIHESWEKGILLLGLEVPPIFRDPESGEVYPRFLRRLQRRLSRVLRQALYEFIRVQTSFEVENYLALGTRTVPDQVWQADRELSSIERAFEMLLLTSPVNEDQAWRQFRDEGYEKNPTFHYRLLPVDPDLLKRRLFQVPLEEIDDPALASLFQDKRRELDAQLSMLDDRGSPEFRYGSMRLYGAVDEPLLGAATSLLAAVSPAPPSREPKPRWVDAAEFRARAEQEFAHYAERHSGITTRRIVVRPDLVGLMVSEGNLLIGEGLRLRPARVAALLHHEVGTHVLTYVNGASQPLEQLSLGLAGYDELQEGLAVLSEYLTGGLDRFRMRLLAGRVVAAHSVEQGAEFIETFRLLTEEYGFYPGNAWHVTTRVHQCGGFTRDLIYLRGLVRLLEHLRGGGPLEPLYIGKIALKHLPIIEELRSRGVLHEPPLLPRVLDDADAPARLDAVRNGINLTDLICPGSE
ncbi:MAG TPA: tyrosine/phenylalanine carboxypeptidase domain-containing protein [Longimicrobiaceae bacterium]